jgi:5-methylcytosine-specific restriction endonuclease McrA
MTVRQQPKRRGVARTPPYPAHTLWSTAKFWGWIRSCLRKAWLRWPPRYELLGAAKVRIDGRYQWKCDECSSTFPKNKVEVDHIVPVGSLKCAEDLPSFVTNLFASVDNLRVLCKDCHKKHTASLRNKEAEHGA